MAQREDVSRDLLFGLIALQEGLIDQRRLMASLRVWSRGEAGVAVPLTIYRDGRTLDLKVASADRNRFFKTQSLH